MAATARAAEIAVSGIVEATEECYRRGWTDGLPVVPPTVERVTEMLEHVGLPPEHVLGEVPARRRVLTADRAAANAVMAGCLPAYFPVVLGALSALFHHDPNIVHEISAATNAPGFLLLVNGPIRERLGLNSRDNLLSSTSRPNATIGRALRLIFMNVFESREGVLDRACMGSLSKLGVCFGEDEERSPWPPLHTTRGFAAGESTVTMASIQDPEMVGNRYGQTAESVMDAVADSIATHGLGVHFTFMDNAWLLASDLEKTVLDGKCYGKGTSSSGLGAPVEITQLRVPARGGERGSMRGVGIEKKARSRIFN
jgi:hypothetical protein